MTGKAFIIVVLLLLFPSFVTAQESARRNVIVPLADGGFVAFKSETALTGGPAAFAGARIPQGEFRARAFTGDRGVIHRVLADATGKYVFGYDLLIEAVPVSKTFTIAVAPLDSQVEHKLLAEGSSLQLTGIATLPEAAEPQILDDGDSFALDLLVNQKAGVKIVDFVKVSFDRSNLWDDNPRDLPKDFTLDAVPLRVIDFRLLIDGNLVAAGKPGTIFTGALIWCYVEGKGRFIFSLVPREGYQFQKVGIIEDNRIEFTVKGKRFEWLSSEPILPSGGSWNLWVLHDPTYTPFGTQAVSRHEKSSLDKLDDSIKAVTEKAARIRDPLPSAYRKQTGTSKSEDGPISPKRFRVMVGAADRMENLWPK